MKFDVTKCAEIFRYGPNQYMFSCAYCIEDFNSLPNVLTHIEHHFPVDAIKPAESIVKNEDDSENQFNIIEKSEATFDDKQIIFFNIEPVTELSDLIGPENASVNDVERDGTDTVPLDDSEQLPEKTGRLKIRWGPTDNKSIVECDICKSLMRKQNIYRHIHAHANLRKFVCDQCQRGYNTKPQLKRHIATHSNVKKFNCDYCGWQFHDRTNLIVHIRRHTGEKPYKCNICNKSFPFSSPLIIHMRGHTGDKPFPCTICKQTFNARNMLHRHLLTHSSERSFQCAFCDRSYYSAKTLREHKRAVHTGERPYTCSICNSSFSRGNTYRQHIILHTGKKPYKCRFCDLTFAQGAGRRSHERSVHKDIERKNQRS